MDMDIYGGTIPIKFTERVLKQLKLEELEGNIFLLFLA